MPMRWTWLLGLALLWGGCADEDNPDPPVVTTADVITEPDSYELDAETILSPEACAECHPRHYEEWAGSMHAYASEDPIFVAMNQRGQRETNGALGDFCVACHAPMAVRLGLTTDGSNLESLPKHVQGITCYFCHAIESVDGEHNAQLTLSDDLMMRGGYDDPVPNTAHGSVYSKLHDRNRIESAGLCGTCHDIVTPPPHEVHIEQTYKEWQESLFAHPVPGEQQTCGSCHMGGSDNTAADAPGVKLRIVHDHKMPGIDLAITEFDHKETQRQEVQSALDSTLFARVCVSEDEGTNVLQVRLENIASGHSFPSGATQDRRVWVELEARDGDGAVLYSSGKIDDETPVSIFELDDPDLWRLGSEAYDSNGEHVHMFWDIASMTSELLEAPTAFSPLDPDFKDVHRRKDYHYVGAVPEEVTMKVHVRAVGLDFLQDLVESGDLDPVHLSSVETLTLESTKITWKAELGTNCHPPDHQTPGL